MKTKPTYSFVGMKKLFIYYFMVLLLVAAFSCEAQTVYITKTGEKYHRGTCQYLRSSKFEIKLEEAKKRGYTACSVCKPTTVVTKDTTKVNNPIIKPDPVQKNVKATQCTATTKAGARCKRMTTNLSGKCWQHE